MNSSVHGFLNLMGRRRGLITSIVVGAALGWVVGCVNAGYPAADARLAASKLEKEIMALRSDAAPTRVVGQDLRLFERVFDLVKEDYVHPVDDNALMAAATEGLKNALAEKADLPHDQLVGAATKAMLSSLDPYSEYMDRRAFQSLREETRGRFGGLGIEITKRDGPLKVVSPIEGTPAARAGLMPGDIITHADGTPIEPLSLVDAVELLRGEPGTSVLLTIARANTSDFDVSVRRELIQVVSVKSRLEGDVGYLRISSFSEDTGADLADAIQKIRDETQDKVQAFVLDLRNNPGGLLTQSVRVADLFLESGLVVYTKGRDHEQRFESHGGDLTNARPMVVLINKGSASASEIVAGALQDRRRAALVGEKSFGKGSVQTIFDLPDRRGMKLTTALYFTPGGHSVEGGITPDIEIADDPDTEEDEQLRRALALAIELAGGPSVYWNSGAVQ